MIYWTDEQKVDLWLAYNSAPADLLVEKIIYAYSKVFPTQPALWRGFDSQQRLKGNNVYAAIKTLHDFKDSQPEARFTIHSLTKPPARPPVSDWLAPGAEFVPDKPAPAPVPEPTPQAPSFDAEMRRFFKGMFVEVIAEGAKAQQANLDDRLEIMLDLMTERMTRFEVQVIELLKPQAQWRTPVKKPTVLIIGGRDKDRSQIAQRFPALVIDNVEEGLKDLATKGVYDMVIHWTTFSSHSTEDLLRNKYPVHEKVHAGQGLSTIYKLISTRFPK